MDICKIFGVVWVGLDGFPDFYFNQMVFRSSKIQVMGGLEIWFSQLIAHITNGEKTGVNNGSIIYILNQLISRCRPKNDSTYKTRNQKFKNKMGLREVMGSENTRHQKPRKSDYYEIDKLHLNILLNSEGG